MSVCPGPGPVPSTLHTFAIERFQNSVDDTPSGLSLMCWPSIVTEPEPAARSTQSFGFGMFRSTSALKSCSPIDAYTSAVTFQTRSATAVPIATGAATPESRVRSRVPTRSTTTVPTTVNASTAVSIRPSGHAHSRFARARIARPCAS